MAVCLGRPPHLGDKVKCVGVPPSFDAWDKMGLNSWAVANVARVACVNSSGWQADFSLGVVQKKMKIWRPRFRLPSVPIRTLIILWAISMFLAWAVLVAGWHTAKKQLSGLGDRVFENILVISTVHDLELAVLGYTREELLWHATYGHEHQEDQGGDHHEQDATELHNGEHHEHNAGEHQKSRDEYLRTAEQIVANSDSYVTSDKTRELWMQAQEGLAFFREHTASCTSTPRKKPRNSTPEIWRRGSLVSSTSTNATWGTCSTR